MRIAAFMSHPIQHFTPLWRELSQRAGVTLKVFYYSRAAIEQTHDKEFGRKIAWDVDLLGGHQHEFLPRRWPTRDATDSSWKALNANLGSVAQQGWDAVYMTGWNYINNWTVLRACQRLGIPVLAQSDTSILTAFDKSWVKLAAKRWIVGRFIRRVSAWLAVGDHNRAFLLEYGATPEKVFFVPIPVDVARFRQSVERATADDVRALKTRYGIPDGKRIITFSGKLVPRKRPQDLCAAVQRLGRDDVVAVLIGEGPLRGELESGGYRNVVITGFVNQAEMPLLNSLADVLVMPSSYDAHPLAVTEALSVGVPVVLSSRCGCYGPNDVLRDGEDGLVYECGNVDDLAGKIARLLDDESGRRQMGQRGRELADTQSPARAADALLAAAGAVTRGQAAVAVAR